jgi:uncharacterized phiE125 gp8 family phage protein
MALVLLTPPAAEPLSLAEVKLHLKVDTAADDALIANLIVAARQAAEEHGAMALVTQAWRLRLDAFPAGPAGWWDGWRQGSLAAAAAGAIVLPRPPLLSVSAVRAYDDADTASVMPPADYFVDTAAWPGRVVLRAGKSWPAARLRPAGGVEVDFSAGFGAGGSAVPWAIRQGLLTHIAWLYQNRGDGWAAMPSEAQALYRPYRLPRL